MIPVLFMHIDKSDKAGCPSLHITFEIRTFDQVDSISSIDYSDFNSLKDYKTLTLRGYAYGSANFKNSPLHWMIETDRRLEAFDICRLAEAIKRLERKLSRIEKEIGSAETFSAYLGYYAKALGIKAVVRKAPRDDGFQKLEIVHAVSLVSSLEREWLQAKPQDTANANA